MVDRLSRELATSSTTSTNRWRLLLSESLPHLLKRKVSKNTSKSFHCPGPWFCTAHPPRKGAVKREYVSSMTKKVKYRNNQTFPTSGVAEARLRLDDPHWSSQPASQPSSCALKRAFNPAASEKYKKPLFLNFVSQKWCGSLVQWKFCTKKGLGHATSTPTNILLISPFQ